MTKLQLGDINVNFKYIYTRGKGSVTELIAKWLCSMGVPPEAVVVHELMERYALKAKDSEELDEDDASFFFMENNKQLVDENPKIFKWLSLLRRQFPLSTQSDYIIANMSWEYAVEWQKSMKKYEELAAVVHCLSYISNGHLRLGLFSITWCTYIKQVFDLSCRLVNKVGKLPKEQLCSQDLNLGSESLKRILEIITRFMNDFYECSITLPDRAKCAIQFEKIWDESLPCLVEVAQDTKKINCDILKLIYQMSCTIYYQCYFNVKFSNPLDTLYDIDYQVAVEALTGNTQRVFNLKPSEKLINPRMKYLTKLIRVAVETISCTENRGQSEVYNDAECMIWIENISRLAELWEVDANFVQRQYVSPDDVINAYPLDCY